MDSQPGIDRDISRDADPGASPKNPMDMDMGTADRNMGIESDADTDIPAERQPGATTDNLMNRAAFDQALEQDQDVNQENLPIDQDRSMLDQNQDQSILDQDRDQDQSVLPDHDSTVTSPEMSTTDRDGMGIVR
jgi:hypothetical protein